jgi:hypothetical protein
VEHTTTNEPTERVDNKATTGVDNKETTGVDNEETTGVDDHPDLKSYVNELEAELDNKIATMDSDYDPKIDTDSETSDIKPDATLDPIDEHEADAIQADATREQTSADDNIDESDDEDDESESEDKDDGGRPLSRLRRNRVPSYGHLKGQDGDGSLPTIARPDKFKGGKHQAHVILQSIILTQYNFKQGIKNFGDDGKAAVLVELQQLHDRHVMRPVDK